MRHPATPRRRCRGGVGPFATALILLLAPVTDEHVQAQSFDDGAESASLGRSLSGSRDLPAPRYPTGRVGPLAPLVCIPDSDFDAVGFSSPPVLTECVEILTPIGTLSPGGGHVHPTKHVRAVYSDDCPNERPFYAMADGYIFLITRVKEPIMGGPDWRWDYEIYIAHSCSVVTTIFHLHVLGPALEAWIADNVDEWAAPIDPDHQHLALGQPDGPPMYFVSAGEEIGAKIDDIEPGGASGFSLGVMDKRVVSGTFVRHSTFRIPSNFDLVEEFLPDYAWRVRMYQFAGHNQLNAEHFVNYMDGALRDAYLAVLNSGDGTTGVTGWDVPGHLRGVWFNPRIDQEFFIDFEVGALSIGPWVSLVVGSPFPEYSDAPDVQVGWGVAANGVTEPSLALLDPVTWDPPITGVDQIRRPFAVYVDPLSDVVNPDPARVGPGATVCYDLVYTLDETTTYDTMLVHLAGDPQVLDVLRVLYQPSGSADPQCATLHGAGYPPVDDGWVTLVR
jgi:hypothetical protein